MIFFDVLTEMYTCHLLHLLGAEIPLASLDQILLTSHLAYLSEGVSGDGCRRIDTTARLAPLPTSIQFHEIFETDLSVVTTPKFFSQNTAGTL